MARHASESAEEGSSGTRRIIGFAVILVVAGIAVPHLRNGDIGSIISNAEPKGGFSSRFPGVTEIARTVTTRQRMQGIKSALKLWSSQHGTPSSGDLLTVVGKATATDEWGHRIIFIPPTRSSMGCLRSYGSDGRNSSDDVLLPVTWDDLTHEGADHEWQ